MTDECYDRFLYYERAVFAGVAAGREGNGGGGRIAFEDLCDDRLAHRLRAGPGAVVGGIIKLQSHSTSNPTSIAQKAAIEALRGPQDSVAPCSPNTGSAAIT